MLLAALIIGTMGGILGSTFIKINNTVNIQRKEYLKKKWVKVLEAILIAFLTASIFYVAVIANYYSKEN